MQEMLADTHKLMGWEVRSSENQLIIARLNHLASPREKTSHAKRIKMGKVS